MPIYEYTCNECSETFECLVFGHSEEVSCPACGGQNVKKKMSVFAFSSGGNFTASSSGDSCGSCSKSSCSGCSCH